RTAIDLPRATRESAPVHERRVAATMVLIQSKDRLDAGDADVVEGLLREAKTWALVDPLAGDLVGPLSEKEDGFEPVLERWAQDEGFWIRRFVLLAHLVPLRQGRGDVDRFSRVADAMVGAKEFFTPKAIGWVLRDTSHKRPDLPHRQSAHLVEPDRRRVGPGGLEDVFADEVIVGKGRCRAHGVLLDEQTGFDHGVESTGTKKSPAG